MTVTLPINVPTNRSQHNKILQTTINPQEQSLTLNYQTLE